MRWIIIFIIAIVGSTLINIDRCVAFQDWDKDFCHTKITESLKTTKPAFIPRAHKLLNIKPVPIKFWVYKQGIKKAIIKCGFSIYYKTIVDAAHEKEIAYTKIQCKFLKPVTTSKSYLDRSGRPLDKEYFSNKTVVKSNILYRKKKQDYIIDIDLSPTTLVGLLLAEGLSPVTGNRCYAESLNIKVLVSAQTSGGNIKIEKKRVWSRFQSNAYFWFTNKGVFELFYDPTLEFMRIDTDYLRIPQCTPGMVSSATDVSCYHEPKVPASML